MPATVKRRGLGSALTVVRLLKGLVRRGRAGLLVWVWLVPSAMRIFVKEDVNVGWLMAASMGLAVLLGTHLGDGVGCREHRILPITDRDLWVTRWLTATLVAPSCLLLLKGVGVAVTAAEGKPFMAPETLLLSTLYDAVYAGALVAVPLLLPRVWSIVGKRLDRFSPPVGSPQRKAMGWLIVIAVFTFVPLFFLGIGAPLLFARQLPTHLVDFSTTSILVLTTGLTMSIAALVWTPRNGGAPLLFQPATAPSRPVASKSAGQSDRLTGVLSVLWTHIRSTFVFTSVVIVVGMATVPFLPVNTWTPRFVTGMCLIFIFVGISMFGVWAPWARRLKVLPLSVDQVNALFVLTPLVTWLEIWLMAMLMHVAMGLPINIELGPLAVLAYAGICAISQALELWLKGSVVGQTVGSMVGVMAAVGTAMLLFENPGAWTQPILLLIGLCSMTIAALINHFTLTRSTSSARAYRALGVSTRP